MPEAADGTETAGSGPAGSLISLILEPQTSTGVAQPPT